MTASTNPDEVHFITHIYVLDQDQNLVTLQELDPTGVDVASINFTIPIGTTSLTAYEWCNKHGLWEGPTVSVPIDFCPTMHAEFLRRQANAPWFSAQPYNVTGGAKHTPYITVNGSVAVVKVGDGSPYHPMSA